MYSLKPKFMFISIAFAALLAVMALCQSAYAGGECASLGGACDDGGWDPMAKLDEIGNATATQQQSSASWPSKSREQRWGMGSSSTDSKDSDDGNATGAGKDEQAAGTVQNASSAATAQAAPTAPPEPAAIVRSEQAAAILVPLESVTDADILLDVSENSSTHIAGSVVLPYMQFNEQAGIPKNVSEISRILGGAGISSDDSVVIYGECLPCGGGPSVATYVYWMMKSLGHEKVAVLDGTAEDWAASGRDTTQGAAALAGKVYTPAETGNYTATYDLVEGGKVQIVDARTVQEYGSGSIPGAINIPYAGVLDGKRIKGEEKLEKIFRLLDKGQPVVVFTNTGMKASVVWFALEMMGYDARLYSYKDWAANQN